MVQVWDYQEVTIFFEACEYRRHFLSYHPDYAIMTNIDFDHPDYFKISMMFMMHSNIWR